MFSAPSLWARMSTRSAPVRAIRASTQPAISCACSGSHPRTSLNDGVSRYSSGHPSSTRFFFIVAHVATPARSLTNHPWTIRTGVRV